MLLCTVCTEGDKNYTWSRIDRATVPENFFVYETGEYRGEPCMIDDKVVICDFGCTIISKNEIPCSCVLNEENYGWADFEKYAEYINSEFDKPVSFKKWVEYSL